MLTCERRELLEGRHAVCQELTLADHMGRFDPGERCSGRSDGLEPLHRVGDLLDEAVILLEDVVEILDLQNFDCLARPGELEDGVHCLKAGQIGSTSVDHHPVWHAIGGYGAPEEAPCRSQIAALAKQEIKGLPVPVDSSIEVVPPALYTDVGLVHSPGQGRGSLPGLSFGRD